MDIKQFILHFPIFIVGLAALTSLISFRNHYPHILKKLSVLWCINFSIDLAGNITRALGLKNHWLYNIYFWILYMGLAYLYQQQLQDKLLRHCIRVFYFLFPLLVTAESIVFGIKDLRPISVIGGSIFMVFLSACYFRQLYLNEETDKITRDPWFWFSFGFLIYFGGTAPFLGMINYLLKNYPLLTRKYYLYFTNALAILLNLLIIAGFLCRRNYHKLS